jgi:TPP-dependent pyruvate/acetoin dehydrogenase alpha subunit
MPETIAQLARTVPADKGFALIANRKLFALYAAMLGCRELSGRLERLAKKDAELAVDQSRGREAAIAAATLNLKAADTVAPGESALVPCFAKGMSALAIASVLAGEKPRQSWAKRNLIPPAFDFATQLKLAVVAARAARAQKSTDLTVVFAENTAAQIKLLKPIFKLAGAEKLPILFLLFSEAASPETIDLARRNQFAGVVVDVHDAVGVYRVVTESAAHARKANGATLIECRPWPLDEASPNAIKNIEAKLKQRGILAPELKKQTRLAVQSQFEGFSSRSR